ncbi:DUF2269 domain-containing protein [Corynebacterium uberis]|uniref:DUF2269 domain-containing protein n=1 Tax=Corynebacterium TaxID=1716 RepID=UPI001D0BE375|nr:MULTISPECIES: DUF2269 domain-containing protein [Corynebacterium]MCZ9308991.1 DUF2269 domain-containing protein [Corynebacterium sp. c6VSa_13]UDL74541.1 DUF2269 domain-containing protein [Corynebacterium uberis]UDL76625.1 DUF2269 domain-containing protein [Corynebacterium uberis]UDL78838.1 DUF2269 domain-containing protein [Corynebacterium uberis]UDL81116.1 DUF2269 domain-containing protein [Corynebacterium uberis]
MNSLMIILHALAAVLFLGPVTVAASTFHTYALKAHKGDERAAGIASLLHRITNTYGVLSALVPVLGVAVMFTDLSTYFHEIKYHVSILLGVIAWAMLLFLIIPRQKAMMAALGLLDEEDKPAKPTTISNWEKAKKQLSMFGGIFSLLWVIILVLMFL